MQREMWFYVPTYHYSFLKLFHLSVLSIGLLSLSIATNSKDNNDHKIEFACQENGFSISCNGSTISIDKAFYGRLDNVTCVQNQDGVQQHWNTNCRSPNATKVIKNKCNNQTRCTLNERKNGTYYKSLFGNPCPGTAKYLYANYTCLPDNNDGMTENACEWHNLSISCHGGTIIRIFEAFYGRLDNDTCVEKQDPDGIKKGLDRTNWNTKCSSPNATEVVKEKCNNQTSCTLNPENKDDIYNSLFDGDPCSGTTKYLSATYACLSDCHCDSDSTTTRKVSWPRTICGDKTSQECPNNRLRHEAFRYCSKGESRGEWMHPNLVGCITEEIENMRNKADNLVKRNFSVDSTKAMMLRVKIISECNDLYGGDLYELTRVMVDLAKLSSENVKMLNYTEADNLIEMVLNSTGNLLSNVYNETWKELLPADRSLTAARLLDALETSCTVLAKAADNQKSINKAVAGIELQINVFNITQMQSSTSTVSFKTPDVEIDIELEDVKTRSYNDGKLDFGRTTFILYDDIAKWLYVTQSTPVENTSHQNGKSLIISKVVSASILTNDHHSTETPARFTMRHQIKPLNSTITSCVFWKFSQDGSGGHWSKEGLKVVASNSDNTTCKSGHLTNFAILMSPVEMQSDIVTKIGGILTTIGCSISVAALLLTIIIYAITWKEAKSHQAVVLLNLCVALIAAQTIFLVGVDKTDPKIWCTVVAVLLHYFFLAAFFIMLVEGIQLLIYAVFVFHAKRKRETASLLVAAWVLPLLIVSISLGVTKADGYGSNDICWLSVRNNLIWAFVGPVLTIIGVNIVVTIIVLIQISTHKMRSSKNSSSSKIRGMFWNVAVICPILGLTWLFGVFSESSAVFVFVFTIVNSLQGLFILIFHAIFFNKKFNARLWSFAMLRMGSNRNFKRQKSSEDETATKPNAVIAGGHRYNEIQSQSFPNTTEEQTVSIDNSTALSTMSFEQARTDSTSILNAESTNL